MILADSVLHIVKYFFQTILTPPFEDAFIFHYYTFFFFFFTILSFISSFYSGLHLLCLAGGVTHVYLFTPTL